MDILNEQDEKKLNKLLETAERGATQLINSANEDKINKLAQAISKTCEGYKYGEVWCAISAFIAESVNYAPNPFLASLTFQSLFSKASAVSRESHEEMKKEHEING